MAKPNDTGVYQLKNGNWAFRYTIMKDGRKKDIRKAKDEFGATIYSKKDAIAARQAAIRQEQNSFKPTPPRRRTVKEVYQEFCENGRKDRAYRTKQKQDSLWNNHLCQKFGKRYVDEINSSEVNDYLVALYCEQGYSYQYTESFLKMFYLIFGQAYSRNYLPVDLYNRLCVNKDTKIKMPKMKTEDDTAIVAFSRKELALLDEYFKGTNAETAYLLGRYCGLRINETFGLKWSNVDLTAGTITIDRQMQYQDGLIKLVSPKTRNSIRTLALPHQAVDLLIAEHQKHPRNPYLFPSPKTGTMYDPDAFRRTHDKILKAIGAEHIRFHDLRHTFATLSLKSGVDVKTLSGALGHYSAGFTLNTYTHATAQMKQDAADTIGGVISQQMR